MIPVKYRSCLVRGVLLDIITFPPLLIDSGLSINKSTHRHAYFIIPRLLLTGNSTIVLYLFSTVNCLSHTFSSAAENPSFFDVKYDGKV